MKKTAELKGLRAKKPQIGAEKTKFFGGDVFLVCAVVLLTVIGTVFIYSASSYSAKATYNDSFYFVKKQVIGIALGLAGMIAAGLFDYKKIKKAAIFIEIAAPLLLAAIFIPGVGVENYGAKRWIGLGPITFQPSETAKFALIVFAAKYVSDNPEKARTLKGSLPVLIYGGLLCGLIIIEPNMSITVCVALLMLAMLLASGMKLKYFLFILIPAIIGAIGLILIEPYRLNRLSAFLNPWASPKGEGYQLLQSLYALGSGGWFGVGYLNSRQKLRFLPFSESDFILAVIGEETGFVGLAVFFALILFVIIRGIKIAVKAKDHFGYLSAVGITCIYAVQSLVNALVVTGSIPPTGLPLPLVSAGNTSLIVFLFSFGVLYNVSRRSPSD